MMMSAYADEQKLEKNPTQWIPIISGPTEVTLLVYSLELITKIGKNFPILFLSLASLNVLLATNDFITNNIEFGIVNSLFAANGFVFLIQTHQSNKIQRLALNPNKTDSTSLLEIKE